MKIALAQIAITAGQLADNFTKIRNVYEKFADSCDLIAFPEMALPGYLIGDTWEQNAFLRQCERYSSELAKLSGRCVLVFGNVGIDWQKKNEDGRVRKYNAAFCAQNGKLVAHPKLGFPFWPKTLSPNYREFNETRYFFDLRKLAFERSLKLDELLAPLEIQISQKKQSLALNICEDAWDEDYAVSPIKIISQNYPLDLILNISCSPFSQGKGQKRTRLFQNLVSETKVPMAYVNCVGTQNVGKTVFGFDGDSSVFLKKERVLRLESFQERILICDLAAETSQEFSLAHKIIPTISSEKKSETAELYQALTSTLRHILQEWQITKVVIGASGGIDSALAAVLYSAVLGPKSVYLINMPSQFNSELTKGAAQQLADNLQCPYAVVPIQDAFHMTYAQISQIKFQRTTNTLNCTGLVLENIQARDRSARVLAAIAASLGGVFTCNANKTELTAGYCTLYGDAGGFLAILADLWKHQVYALAEYYNQSVAKAQIIPEASFKIVPSAELSDQQDIKLGQGDPFIFPYHDALFKSWVDLWERKTPEDLLEAYLEDKVENILGMSRKTLLNYFKNDIEAFLKDLERWWLQYRGMGAFKRMQTPPVLALSRRTFGGDHQEHLGKASLSSQYYELKKKILESSL